MIPLVLLVVFTACNNSFIDEKYQLMKFLNLLILQQLLPNQFLLKMLLSLLWQHRQS